MPVRFPIDTFFESSGNAAAEFTEAVRDGVATFACGLWNNFPGFITQGTNPANAFARGFMNRACSPIQPPVPAPSPPFVGGQCPTQYDINVLFDYFPAGSGTIANFNQTIFTNILGPITAITDNAVSGNNTFNVTVFFPSSPSGTVTVVNAGSGANILADTITYEVTRVDGMPDNCGSLPSQYTSPPPTINDLRQTTNILINDGLDLSLDIQYNQLSNQYNFPMNFKINGVNVTLDIGGITIYPPDGFSSPSGGNDVPPPGSDGGEDGIGNPIDDTYPDGDYPAGPDGTIVRDITEAIEYLVCTDGVIETVTESLKISVGYTPILTIIIDILGQILTDICETPEASLGLPEYYGLQPGVDRPAIVYLWKIFAGGKWGASTYSSTVFYPTDAAIEDIENLTNIEKTIGTIKTFVRLTDGSVIQATGSNEAQSTANFEFLINQVNPVFLPANLSQSIITQEDARLGVKILTLRQVEYYPDGKKDNVAPTIKRTINPSST